MKTKKPMKLYKGIWQHLITKQKYNRIENKLELEFEKEERLIYQKNTYKKLSEEQQKIFNKSLKKYVDENIFLKERLFIINAIIENNSEDQIKQIEEVLNDIDLLKGE